MQIHQYHKTHYLKSKDLYQILGVSRKATKAEIQKAYHELAKKYHPDLVGADKNENEKIFHEITSAYVVLSDPKQREKYDSVGETMSSTLDSDKIFTEIGNQGLSCLFSLEKELNVSKGRNIEQVVTLSPFDCIKGTNVKVSYDAYRQCDDCDGTGSANKTKPTICEDCKGSGYDPVYALVNNLKIRCSKCDGHGSTVDKACKSCNQEGIVLKKIKLEADIPKGVYDDVHVRVRGKGHVGKRSGKAGDLLLRVKVKQDYKIEIHKNDIMIRIPVNLSTAILGGTVEVPTPYGKRKITIPPGTQHDDQIKIEGCGTYNHLTGKNGDLIVTCIVIIPRQISEKDKEIFQEFAKTEEKVTPNFKFSEISH